MGNIQGKISKLVQIIDNLSCRVHWVEQGEVFRESRPNMDTIKREGIEITFHKGRFNRASYTEGQLLSTPNSNLKMTSVKPCHIHGQDTWCVTGSDEC